MIIIPAIDIKGGRCVRLYQGRMDKETVYSEDPVEVARRWEDMGAEMLHVVDLDGAVSGKTVNFEVVKQIVSSVKLNVQVGGGIRDLDTVKRYLLSGVHRVVLGTAVLNNTGFINNVCSVYPGQIVVSIDAKDGMVAVKGWTEITESDAIGLAKTLEGIGIRAIVFTDIKRDGTLSGPNIESICKIVSTVNIPVIASGGISDIKDISTLLSIRKHGLEGVIIGKAIYSGAVDLKEAIVLTKQGR